MQEALSLELMSLERLSLESLDLNCCSVGCGLACVPGLKEQDCLGALLEEGRDECHDMIAQGLGRRWCKSRLLIVTLLCISTILPDRMSNPNSQNLGLVILASSSVTVAVLALGHAFTISKAAALPPPQHKLQNEQSPPQQGPQTTQTSSPQLHAQGTPTSQHNTQTLQLTSSAVLNEQLVMEWKRKIEVLLYM